MEERIFDYWVATLQDGYLTELADMTAKAGGAGAFYEMTPEQMVSCLGITGRLAEYIEENKKDPGYVEMEYYKMMESGICYVNHTDTDFPDKLRHIPHKPYGLFVKGQLPDPQRPAVAIIGARECSEYGRMMAEYFGDRLAKHKVQIISGMAWGIDGIAQMSAVAAGGHSYAVLGCGVDIAYPARNRVLYRKLCENGNGVISEYAPGSAAEARRFPPRNRIISGLCDVLIVVEARARSGTLITVDMAIEQGRTVMVVPGRLTDNLSVGCLNLLYQGALVTTGIESVLEQLGMGVQMKLTCLADNTAAEDDGKHVYKHIPKKAGSVDDDPANDLQKVEKILTLDPASIDVIAGRAHLTESAAMIALTKLEMQGLAKEVSPGFFIKCMLIS